MCERFAEFPVCLYAMVGGTTFSVKEEGNNESFRGGKNRRRKEEGK
jgi:hypothetical protein